MKLLDSVALLENIPDSGLRKGQVGTILLIVSFTERTDNCIRMISARLATIRERKDYEQHRRY